MPFYEYECSSCKFYVEALQKISDEPLRKCPSCKKQTLKKLVSAPVFRLKGGGWYETDFKSEQEGKRNLAGADEAPPEAKAEESPKKEDAKPAEAKTPAKEEPKAGPKKAAAKPVARAATKPSRPKAKAKTKAARKKARR